MGKIMRARVAYQEQNELNLHNVELVTQNIELPNCMDGVGVKLVSAHTKLRSVKVELEKFIVKLNEISEMIKNKTLVRRRNSLGASTYKK